MLILLNIVAAVVGFGAAIFCEHNPLWMRTCNAVLALFNAGFVAGHYWL